MTAAGVPRPRRRWPLFGAVLALAVVVVTALALRSSPDPDPEPAAAAPAASTGTPTVPSVAPTASPSSSSPPAVTPTGPSAAAPSRPPGPAASTSPTPRATRSSAPGRTQPTDPAGAEQASTRPPVPLDEPDRIERGLTARVSRIESVPGEASGPGEIAGPALRASVTLSNESGRSIDLTSTVVNLYYGADETPASVLSGPDAAALPDRVPPGEAATGRFVFSVPPEGRDEVLITVDYSVTAPVVAFRGAAPR